MDRGFEKVVPANPITEGKILYTIGHSNYPLADFFALLSQHEIQVLVDVRSSPYSKYATHFNAASLKVAMQNSNCKYLFLGDELGGKPKDQNFYNQDGKLQYDLLSQSASFKNGIQRLLQGITKYRIALMCGEEDPSGCHRKNLIGPAVVEQGIKLLHIRKGGKLYSDEELINKDERIASQNLQLSLFKNP